MSPGSGLFAQGAWAAVAGALFVLPGCATSGVSGDGPVGAATPGVSARCEDSVSFALSLASDTRGEPTPVDAATWFAAHGGIASLPEQGWRVVDQNAHGATLRAGSSSVHVVRGRDATWQVDSGTRCVK